MARVDIVFAPGRPPHGSLSGPSPTLVADTMHFGGVRIRRWFGRDRQPY